MSFSFERYLEAELSIENYEEMLLFRALALADLSGTHRFDSILRLPSPAKEEAFVAESLRRLTEANNCW